MSRASKGHKARGGWKPQAIYTGAMAARQAGRESKERQCQAALARLGLPRGCAMIATSLRKVRR